MLKIGLTGGIGVGKTKVSDYFAEIGVPIVDTDVIAHSLVAPGLPAYHQIVDAFGSEILDPDGNIDRPSLRRLIFANPEKKKQLEAILHPQIHAATLAAIRSLEHQHHYCLVVVPLLVETGFVDIVDRILVVDAPDEKRIPWIGSRSGLTNAEIKQIIASQTGRDQRNAAADDIIFNDGTITDMRAKIEALHTKYLAVAGTN